MVTQRLRRSAVVGAMAVWAGVMAVSPGRAFAMPSASVASVQTASVREAQIQRIVQVLSQPQAQIHLRMAGISPAQLREGLSRMDDAQLAQVAQKAENVKAGGELGLVIALLVVLILIIVVIKLMNKDIEIKDE